MTARKRAPHGLGAADYDQDLDAWSQEQVHLLRAGAWSRLDIEHLADEIAEVGRSERHALTSALSVILLHMLKWDHRPGRRSRYWVTSIRTQRLIVQEWLEDSPSLRSQVGELVTRAYRRARIEASGETGLDEDTFPEISLQLGGHHDAIDPPAAGRRASLILRREPSPNPLVVRGP